MYTIFFFFLFGGTIPPPFFFPSFSKQNSLFIEFFSQNENTHEAVTITLKNLQFQNPQNKGVQNAPL